MKVIGLVCNACENEWLSNVRSGQTLLSAIEMLAKERCEKCGARPASVSLLDLPGTRALGLDEEAEKRNG